MEADLQRYYRLDLLDLYRRRLTWRKVLVLIAALPRESSLVRAVAGEPAEWSVNDYLTANVIDAINHLTYVYVTAHSKTKPPAPQPVPRPERERERARVKPRMSTSNEVTAFFGAINNGR